MKLSSEYELEIDFSLNKEVGTAKDPGKSIFFPVTIFRLIVL